MNGAVKNSSPSLAYNAHIGSGSGQSGARTAHAGDNGDLRHNAGDLCHGGGNSRAAGKRRKALFQLRAHGVVERYDGVARFRGHIQNLDDLLGVFFGHGRACLAHGVNGGAVRAAKRSGDSAVRVKRAVSAFVEEFGKHILAGCCDSH